MAGPVANMADIWKKKPFKYTPPSPPAELIESTSYTLDFANRKFVHIGIDPTEKYQVVDPSEKYQVVIHIMTSSRHVKISPDFLRRIFSMMGHILSFILDVPQKYKRTLFLETEFHKLSSMMYGGENVLVIESKTEDGCRILLNRTDLIRLQCLECCIFETVVRKTVYTDQLIIEQADSFVAYLRNKCDLLKSPPKNLEEMITFVKNAQDERTNKSFPNLVGQIQMFATKQLAVSLLNHATHESFNADSKILSPSCSPKLNISKPDDKILAKPLDHIDGPQSPSCPIREGFEFFNQFDSPPSIFVNHPTAAPLRGAKRRLPQSPASPQPFDVNDGPDFFNPISASTPSTFAEHPAPVRNVKRRLF